MTVCWKSHAMAALAIAASASSASQAYEIGSVKYLPIAPAQYLLEASHVTATAAVISDFHSEAHEMIRNLFEAEANRRSDRQDRTYYFSKELRSLWTALEKRVEAEGIFEGA